jgi:hypothetical protein
LFSLVSTELPSCCIVYRSGTTPLSQEYATLLSKAFEEGKKDNLFCSISEEKKKELLNFRVERNISSEMHFGILKRFGWSLEEYEVPWIAFHLFFA